MTDAGADPLAGRLERCGTAVLHDVMQAQGLTDRALPPEVRPILPGRLCGPAFTVAGEPDGDADARSSLLAWTGLLSDALPGHVWVSQPNDRSVAHMGELSAAALLRKGVRGAVIDGLVRDADMLRDLDFRVWCRGFTPADIAGFWLPRTVGEPVRIGAATIAAGDYVCGDGDGCVAVPRDRAAEIAAAAEAAAAAEDLVRAAILDGTDPQEAYLRHGKF